MKDSRRLIDAVGLALTSDEVRDEALQLAAAVLLVDVARADHTFDDSEFERVLNLVEKYFELDAEAAGALVNRAFVHAEELVSVHEFTRFLHQSLGPQEKARIVDLLWQIACADGQLHPYENALILKISDLLYVNRARSLRSKHDAIVVASET